MVWLISATYLLTILLLIFISIQDLTTRIIANKLVLMISLSASMLALFRGSSPNIALATIILIIGFFLSLVNVIGGGDVKLISALALLFTPALFLDFIFITALCGGIIASIGFVFFKPKITYLGVPYGIAISLAFIFTYRPY